MSNETPTAERTKTPKSVWVGRVISGVLVALLILSGASKFMLASAGGEPLDEMLSHLGLDVRLLVTIGIIELVCVLFYAIPKVSVVGAILLTGYMGGAIFAHLRVGDPPIVQIVIPILIWLGVFLRDERLCQVIPLRRPSPSGGER